MAWLGFACLTCSLPGVAVFAITALNLVPRAFQSHRWYLQKFHEHAAPSAVPFVSGKHERFTASLHKSQTRFVTRRRRVNMNARARQRCSCLRGRLPSTMAWRACRRALQPRNCFGITAKGDCNRRCHGGRRLRRHSFNEPWPRACRRLRRSRRRTTHNNLDCGWSTGYRDSTPAARRQPDTHPHGRVAGRSVPRARPSLRHVLRRGPGAVLLPPSQAPTTGRQPRGGRRGAIRVVGRGFSGHDNARLSCAPPRCATHPTRRAGASSTHSPETDIGKPLLANTWRTSKDITNAIGASRPRAVQRRLRGQRGTRAWSILTCSKWGTCGARWAMPRAARR